MTTCLVKKWKDVDESENERAVNQEWATQKDPVLMGHRPVIQTHQGLASPTCDAGTSDTAEILTNESLLKCE